MATRTGWGRGSTRRWRAFRASIFAEDPRCRACLRNGLVTVATELHHITPLSKGGAEFDPANVEPICGPCHQRTVVAARTGRVRGAAADGTPLDPTHPWNASR